MLEGSHLKGIAVQIAKLVIPGMKQRKPPSAIVNIGSAAATVSPSGPLYAVYAGSKVSCHCEFETAAIHFEV